VVLLVIQPWTGFVLMLVADGRVAYTLLPWESWLPAGSSPPRITTSSGRARDPGAPAGKELTIMNTRIRRWALAVAAATALLFIPLAAAPALAGTVAAAGTPPAGVTFTGNTALIHQVHPANFPHTHLPQGLHTIKTVPRQMLVGQSTNWSGYADKACGTCSLRYVTATFTVPSVNCAKDTTTNQYDASEWVGLDGLATSTAEQTGVDANCNTGSPSYYVWYEMYPLYPVVFAISGFGPGDAVNASVYYNTGTHLWQLTLNDITQGVGFTTNQPCPSGATCQNKSAEVITEVPGGGVPNGYYLADFGQVGYRDATVTSLAGYHGNLGDKSGLWTAYQLSIWNGADQMASTGTLYNSGNLSSFTNTWRSAS
jgi:hypothetical protein